MPLYRICDFTVQYIEIAWLGAASLVWRNRISCLQTTQTDYSVHFLTLWKAHIYVYVKILQLFVGLRPMTGRVK